MGIDWITANELDNWARREPRKAQEILPELIIRLILATSKNIEDFHFPLEKGIQYAGYDGTLTSKELTSFFPSGKSVWEFGTNEASLGKFKADLEKRSDDPLGVDIKSTTFIFATLKMWNHMTSIEETIADAKSKYEWKEIRIYDGQKIKMWLEQCPAVTVWLSKVVGKYIQGVISVEEYWNDITQSTDPILKKEFFLVGRDKQLNVLNEWLDSDMGYKVIKAESALESILFFISALLSNEKSKVYLSRIVIVENKEAWEEIIDRISLQTIFIPIFNFSEEIRCPKGIKAILPVSKYSPVAMINIESIDLPKLLKNEFSKAIEILEINNDKYANIEFKTKRSFLPLYREINTIPMRKRPKWIDTSDMRDLIPAMLAGGWNTDYEGDRAIIEKLSGVKYEEYINIITPWMAMEDAPVFKVLNCYRIVSINDLWTFLFIKMNKKDIDNLADSVKELFSYISPEFDLFEEHWSFASMFGKKRIYSVPLTNGLIISLIMLMDRDGEENNIGYTSSALLVNNTVSQILSSVDTWKHWNSIAESLSLLAEASPTAVLEKLEEEVEKEDAELWKLFKSPKDIIMGRSYYTHILWTLENLVWEEDYAIRAIILLVRISEKRFEYKMTNSPLNSLTEIFYLYHSQGCLTIDNKIKILKTIITNYSFTGWQILNKLFPSGHSVIWRMSKPRWRDVQYGGRERTTNTIIYESIDKLVEISIELISNSFTQWKVIFDNITWYIKSFNSLKEKCIQQIKLMDESDINNLSQILRKHISRYRDFPNAKWSISEADVLKIEDLLLDIMPISILKYKYLFEYNPSILYPIPYDKEHSNFDERKHQIYEVREKAISDILSEYGIEELLKFCAEIKDVNDFGSIFTEKIFNNTYDFVLLKKIKINNLNLYSSILWSLYYKNPTSVYDILKGTNDLKNDEIGDILCHTEMSNEVWKQIESFDEMVIDYYWKNISNRLRSEKKEDIEYYISKLLKYKRPFSLIQFLTHSDYSNSQIILEVLQKSIEMQAVKENNGMTINSVDQYEIITLFEKLYLDENVDENVAVGLEIFYLPYFEDYKEPKYLISYLSNNPEEYVNIVSKKYRADNDTEESREFTELEQKQYKIANMILDIFINIPGLNPKNTNKAAFEKWISRTSSYAIEIGYNLAYEISLGTLLSYSPLGSDGIYPHELVRDLLESNDSKVIEDHFIIGKINQRGVHTTTAGFEENNIAQKFKEYANKIRIEYPRTASILDRLSQSYFDDSRYEYNQDMNNFH